MQCDPLLELKRLTTLLDFSFNTTYTSLHSFLYIVSWKRRTLFLLCPPSNSNSVSAICPNVFSMGGHTVDLRLHLHGYLEINVCISHLNKESREYLTVKLGISWNFE